MKRILITGANSYIGTSFESYIEKNFSDKYVVDTMDMIDGTWRSKSFKGYDSVFHVAGIAHSDNGKVSAKNEKLYYAVNTELTIETAKKAKADGVRQFVFMSSAMVYGDSGTIGKKIKITKDTPAAPANCYGNSKLQAEKGIMALQDEDFRVVVLRPPMVYGPGSKGNYSTLVKIALTSPVFPYVENQRSMLYIDNLCEFVRQMVENDECGMFWPQNKEYSNTSKLVAMIAAANGKKVRLLKGCTWALKLMSHMTCLVDKAFGSFVYEPSMSEYRNEYRVVNLRDSVKEIKE